MMTPEEAKAIVHKLWATAEAKALEFGCEGKHSFMIGYLEGAVIYELIGLEKIKKP